jgi:hypothetical protein
MTYFALGYLKPVTVFCTSNLGQQVPQHDVSWIAKLELSCFSSHDEINVSYLGTVPRSLAAAAALQSRGTPQTRDAAGKDTSAQIVNAWPNLLDDDSYATTTTT